MSNGMKPIDTLWNGSLFRSRLEARWAVFFNELGIKYEYEPEGFKLSTGKLYLPDFYIPYQGWWVEIKPSINVLKECAIAMDAFASDLCLQNSRQATAVVLIVGTPGEETILAHSLPPAKSGWWEGMFLEAIDSYGVEPRRERVLSLVDIAVSRAIIGEISKLPSKDQIRIRKALDFDLTGVHRGYASARSARFEYGQLPIVKEAQ